MTKLNPQAYLSRIAREQGYERMIVVGWTSDEQVTMMSSGDGDANKAAALHDAGVIGQALGLARPDVVAEDAARGYLAKGHAVPEASE